MNMGYRKSTERSTDGPQIKHMMDVLEKYPQGLTLDEIVKGTRYTDKDNNNRIMKNLMNSKEVICMSKKDHTYTYLHEKYTPYLPRGVQHITTVKVNDELRDNVYLIHRILRVLEKYPNGRTIGQIIKEVGIKGGTVDQLYHILRAYRGRIIETPDDDILLPKDERRWRVIGANTAECIAYYTEGRAIALIYYEYERGVVEVKGGRIDPVVMRELVRLIRDIDENKSHTPKDVNIKIRFMENEEFICLLGLTNDKYTIRKGLDVSEYTAEELITYLAVNWGH